jgi:hypothetical protein
MLQIRREELRRRVEALPDEVAQWKQRTQNDLDSNLHFSQLQAIGILVETFVQQQSELLNQLDPAGDSAAFHDSALKLLQSIRGSQHAWDFFRDKLDLRFSPEFKEVLWVADTVAWDCYRPVLDGAAAVGILEPWALREPPLTYLSAELSPLTWVRGSRPNDGRSYHLGTSQIPIPVIELPWDHVENTWELMSLHHEVGHDLEADLKLRGALAVSLQNVLTNKGVPHERVQQWLAWQGEVLADLIALQVGGSPFAECLSHLLLLPEPMVTILDEEDPHPTPYLRILLNAAYIPTMIANHPPLADDSQQIANRWVALYGNQPHFDPWRGDFPLVFAALMDTALPELKGRTVRELMPYGAADDARIRKAVGYMRTGMNKPAKLEPRHCISAARRAVTESALEGALSNDVLSQISQRAMELVRANAPGGLRGGDSSTPHREFIAAFVKAF